MAARLQFIWQANLQRSHSWTETFYVNSTTLAAARARELSLIERLGPIHARNVAYKATRITMLDADGHPSGKSFLAEPLEYLAANPYREVSLSPASEDTDFPSTALLLRLAEDVGAESRQWLHGVDDSYVTRGVFTPNGPAGGGARYTALMNYLTVAANGCVMRVKAENLTRHYIQETSVATSRITTRTPHGIENRARIVFGGVTYNPPLATTHAPKARFPRHWTAIRVSDTVLELPGLVGWLEFVLDFSRAWIRRDQYRFPPINEARVLRATGRRVGRPFGK